MDSRRTARDQLAAQIGDDVGAKFPDRIGIVAECFERIGVTAAKLTELAVIAERDAPTK